MEGTLTHDDIINKEIEQEHLSAPLVQRLIKTKCNTEVFAIGPKGASGENYRYEVKLNPIPGTIIPEKKVCASIKFQNGPIKENGVNGCQNEDLISIVIDRLQGFQNGKFPCRENAIAITKLEEALMWLDKRTADRIERGVEGKLIA